MSHRRLDASGLCEIADGRGRIVVPVGELTDAEMKLIAEAMVPAEHDYDYKDD